MESISITSLLVCHCLHYKKFISFLLNCKVSFTKCLEAIFLDAFLVPYIDILLCLFISNLQLPTPDKLKTVVDKVKDFFQDVKGTFRDITSFDNTDDSKKRRKRKN
jgi:hypothetical protein